jgi:hypothetical protein
MSAAKTEDTFVNPDRSKNFSAGKEQEPRSALLRCSAML